MFKNVNSLAGFQSLRDSPFCDTSTTRYYIIIASFSAVAARQDRSCPFLHCAGVFTFRSYYKESGRVMF
jgi:hypothetical protein